MRGREFTTWRQSGSRRGVFCGTKLCYREYVHDRNIRSLTQWCSTFSYTIQSIKPPPMGSWLFAVAKKSGSKRTNCARHWVHGEEHEMASPMRILSSVFWSLCRDHSVARLIQSLGWVPDGYHNGWTTCGVTFPCLANTASQKVGIVGMQGGGGGRDEF